MTLRQRLKAAIERFRWRYIARIGSQYEVSRHVYGNASRHVRKELGL